MTRSACHLVFLLAISGCNRKHDDATASTSTAATPTSAATSPKSPPETPLATPTLAFDPSGVAAPAWAPPAASARTREQVAGESLAAMLAAERCPLAHGWFAACPEAEALLAANEPIGTATPGSSEAPSRFAAAHIDDPAPAVRLWASWLLANHPLRVEDVRDSPPDWERLATALEQEDDGDVLAVQLTGFALADELTPPITDRVVAVARRALGHAVPVVRIAAIDVLAHGNGRSRSGAVDPVFRAAGLDADATVRSHACRRLGGFGDARIEPWLVQRTASLDDTVAVACLEGALELAVHGPVASVATGNALLERIAAAGPDHPTARALRLLAQVAMRDGAAPAFPRQRLVDVLAGELADANNDLRTRDAAAFALAAIGAGKDARAATTKHVPSLDAHASRLLSRCELAAARAPAPAELALLVPDADLRDPPGPSNLVVWIDEYASNTLSSGDIGARWDAAADAYAVVLTPRSDLDEQQVDVGEAHTRNMLLPPSLVTLVADAAASGTVLPEIGYPSAKDDKAWAKMGETLRAFDRIADGYTINWGGRLSHARWSTAPDKQGRRPLSVIAQRENLRELAEHYEALRSLASRGSEDVIAAGVERIVAGDRGFFGDRRPYVALRATTRQTSASCWIDFAEPCGTLARKELVAEVAERVLVARAKDGDVAIRKYDVSRASVRAELVTLLRAVAPAGTTDTSRVWVEVTGPFVYGGRRGDPTPWLEGLTRELGDAGVDAQRIRWLVFDGRAHHSSSNRVGPTTIRRVLERFGLHDVWYGPRLEVHALDQLQRDG